jgi:UDP-glucose 4-epimerase
MKHKEKKAWLVTGGAGFIGSHIVETLTNQGDRVYVLDNLRSGFVSNIDDFFITFIKGSILDKDLVNELVQKVDGVFHLAALVSVPESLFQIDDCIQINLMGTLNLLEAARENRNCKLILSSSAAIYGNAPQLPKTENMSPEPLTPYATTKLDGEYYLKIFQDQWNVPTASLRYFNVFGPRQNPNSTYAAAVPIFIQKTLRNQPIVIYGDGSQTRDFIYVKDMAQANLHAMTVGNSVYNVALGQSITILELAEKIIQITNSQSVIQFEEERPGDVKHSCADVSKFNSIKFKPSFTLEEGLAQTIAYYKTVI